MTSELEQAVKHCAEQAAKADTSPEAMQYTQAALNAAHAAQVIVQTKQSEKDD